MPRRSSKSKMRSHKKAKALMTLAHFDNMVDRAIEDETIDTAIDSLWLDLLGIYLDCSTIKQSLSVRELFNPNHKSAIQLQCFAPNCEEEDHPSWFEEVGDVHAQGRKDGNPFDKDTSEEQECWNQLKRNMKDAQAPLKATTKLCDKIANLPERDVTLYIRLDEQVPRNSCTAYEVDWEGFNDPKTTGNDLFTIFRLCSRRKGASRTECIVGTLASACLHPYTVVLPGPLQPDEEDYRGGNPPFRPKRVLLDRPEDVCTAELQFYLTRMGMSECQEVSPKLRSLHDEVDLDFFPSDQGDVFNVPSVATVLENSDRARRASAWSTGLPFICLEDTSNE